MKKKGLLVGLLVLMLFTFTACLETKETNNNNNNNKKEETKEEVKIQTIKSDYVNLEFNVPKDWQKLEDGSLNKNADLELGGKKSEKYLMVISDDSVNFDDFDSWYKIVFEANSKVYNFDKSSVLDVTLNGNKAKYIKFEQTSEGVKMIMRVYFVETKNYYSQVYLWTVKSKESALEKEFDDIIQSINEFDE